MTVEPYDETDIGEADSVIRRINPDQHVIWDDNRGCHRISSKAFKPSSGVDGGMSVDIEAKINSDGIDPKEYVTTPIFTGSVQLMAGTIRALGLWIGYDPLPDNPYHGEVWGTPRANRFTKAQNKGLHASSEWYVPLDGIDIK